MNIQLLLIGIIITGLFISAGCTDQGKNSQVSAGITGTPATISANDVAPLVTDIVPSIYEVSVQVEKSTLASDPAITATFRGGAGTNSLSRISMTVTHPDGSIASGSIDHPGVGNTLTLPGSVGKDKVVIVSELPNGRKYRIFDEYMSYRG